MAKTSKTTSAANDMQSLFDPRGYQDAFKTWARFYENMSSITLDAAKKSSTVTVDTTQEAISNLRDISTVRDEPTDYGQAYSDFAQKQMELFMRSARAYTDIMQRAGSETADLAGKTGEEVASKTTQNANEAATKATSAAKSAA